MNDSQGVRSLYSAVAQKTVMVTAATKRENRDAKETPDTQWPKKQPPAVRPPNTIMAPPISAFIIEGSGSLNKFWKKVPSMVLPECWEEPYEAAATEDMKITIHQLSRPTVLWFN